MLERISEIMIDKFELSGETAISEDTDFKEDLPIQSFEMLEFIMAVEDEYKIEIRDEELSGIGTVGDLMDCINNKGLV